MTTIDLPLAVVLTQRLLGAGIFLQTAELLSARCCYAKCGLLEGSPVTPWLGLRLVLALMLVLAPVPPLSWLAVIVHALLLLNSVWLTVRSRGPVCGGSDTMFFQVQLGLLIAGLGFLEPFLVKLGLGWIAAQSVLSYFLAGVSKLRNAGWWMGRALQNLLASEGPYVVFAPARRLASNRRLCAVLGGGMVGLELIFPAVLILPMEGKAIVLSMGLLFHLANALLLGFNRFLWAWAATYPALLALGR